MKKKALSFFTLLAYAVGLIGGLGWTIYSQAYVIAFCVAALGIMAFPVVRDAVRNILEIDNS